MGGGGWGWGGGGGGGERAVDGGAWSPHLVHVNVVKVGGVVDGFEEALELARGPPVHHEHEGDPHRRGRHALGRVLVPLDVAVGFACGREGTRTREGLASLAPNLATHTHLGVEKSTHLHLADLQYREIPPEASRVKCLAQGQNINRKSNQRPSDY